MASFGALYPTRSLAVLAILGLAGCAPALLSANERGGIIEHVNGATEAQAFSIADAHCHQYGRVVRVSGLDLFYNRLMFDCVAP